MQLTNRVLNRTLWLRQHLVTPVEMPVRDMVEHLIGLQAQENLPPYLSLAARLKDFSPESLSTEIADRGLVRFLTMRGTVHVLTPTDALTLRPWVQPALDRSGRSNPQSRPAAHVPTIELFAAARSALADGPIPVTELGVRLGTAFPDVPEAALRHVARERLPLLQVPPRGLWKQSGGVVYELADNWLDERLSTPHLPTLIRRYLRAFGPASPADMTKWSVVTGLGPAFKAMDDLVIHEGPDGKVLYDVPEGPLADPDLALPVRMLGNYDNLWLSHANRERIASDDNRRQWMAANGAVGSALFVDGLLEGYWRLDNGEIRVQPFRKLSRAEQAAVAVETERILAFLAR
ncbi:MAG: hypothetical protein JWR35_281 [Marmoricola sp.]|nr:hypothetical protein [Marmoricola sp.]